MYKVSNYGDYTITKIDKYEHQTKYKHNDRFTIFDTLEEARRNVLERARRKLDDALTLADLYRNELRELENEYNETT